VYTRKSSEEGLELEFNSLHAQRDAGLAYIASQKSEGWIELPDHYDDGGISGGTLERPALKRLLRDVEAGLIDVVVVYKIDRLSRSLTDFAKLVEVFERHNVTFVSVTQQFNTTTSMGRLTLNILLSFAQFEREVIGERISRQVRGLAQEGHVDGGLAAARLRGRGSPAGGGRPRGGAGLLQMAVRGSNRAGLKEAAVQVNAAMD
jgi:DNA invertase Pin-like site-specific DNA recombinase